MNRDDLVGKRIAYLGILVALNVVFTRLFSVRIALGGVEGIRLGVGGLPVIMAGILFGPLAGGIVGAIGDVAGFLISPMGAYMPHFTLSAALTGIIPAVMIKYVFNNKFSLSRALISIGAGQIITSVILVPYFLNRLFEHPFETTIIPAAIGQAISIPLYAFLILVLCRRLITEDILDTQMLNCHCN